MYIELTQKPVGGDAISPECLSPIEHCLRGDTDGKLIPVHFIGTPFQIKVWKALRDIPWGTVVNYSELARAAGNPRATRAAASACSMNPCAIIVPCHRVIRRDMGLGNFFWGLDAKRTLLQREGIRVFNNHVLTEPKP